MDRSRLLIVLVLGFTVAAGCGERGWVDDGVQAAAGAPPAVASPSPVAAGSAAASPTGPAATTAPAAPPPPGAAGPAVRAVDARAPVTGTAARPAPGSAQAPSNPAPSPAAATGAPAAAPVTGGPSAGSGPPAAASAAPPPAAPPRRGRSGPAIGFPAAGSYVYDLSGSTSAGSVPPTGTLQVSDAGSARQRWSTDARDAHNDGWTETFVVEQVDDGLRLVSYRLEYVSLVHVVIEFDVNPPAVFAPRPLTPGRSWSFEATTKDGCYRVHSDGTVGAVDAPVPGGAYHGHRLDTTATVADTGQAGCRSVELRQERGTWFDAATNLVVRDETRTTGKFSSVPFHAEVTALLRSTTAH